MEVITFVYILTALLVSLYLYSKRLYSYWKRRGLEQIEPVFFYGTFKDAATKQISFGDQLVKNYRELKARGLKHGGCYMFFKPFYVPVDIDIIKNILQKDFSHFVNRGMYVNEKDDPLSGHLFNLEDDKWRNLRAKLTPTFTSGKMKMMFQTLVSCTTGLEDILKDHSVVQDAVDIKDIVSRFTTDIIGSVAFGIDCNSLKDPNSEFRQFGKKIFEPDQSKKVKTWMFRFLPKPLLKKMGLKQSRPDMEDFFINLVKNTVQYRETNNIYRKDFMHLLLQLKNKGIVTDDGDISKKDDTLRPEESLTINQMAAQCFVFFAAGFETSATTMSFALMELALNQEIQDQLRKEIETVLKKHDGEVTYEAVMEMTYLDKVVQETLRKHPPLPVMMRVCNKEYRVPGTNVILETGTRVQIPFLAVQRDPDYFPDPEKFDPERFSEENKAKRPGFTFLTFGEGPRICIGARFGLMQSKVGLVAIIRKFRVTLNEQTKTPITYSPSVFISAVDGGVWLNVSSI